MLHFHAYMTGCQVFAYFASIPFNANYTYTHHRPPFPTMFDVLGPWPLYLIVPQVLMWPVCYFIHKLFFLVVDGTSPSSSNKLKRQ
jgi:uncharacterized membrane protein YwaF